MVKTEVKEGGLAEKEQPDMPQPRRLVMLRAGLHAAAEAADLTTVVPRSRFRLVVQRLHQYLEV